MINGNTAGIRQSYLDELETLYDMHCAQDEFITGEILALMAKYSCETNREISVFISRSGRVLDVSIGSSRDVTLPYIRKRRGTLGLSGVRCVHTHPSGTSMLSEVDIGTLLSTRLDAMAAVAVRDGAAKSLTVGYVGESLDVPAIYGPFSVNKIPGEALMAEIVRTTYRVNELIALSETAEETERAILIGLNSSEASMKELERLADTAGARVVYTEIQKRERDKGYYIGSGKAKELALKATALDADIAIFDDELSPVEAKNLEEILGLKIVDRTALILDIFAKHAKSKEGRLQVELAQMKYNLPRLIGEGAVLSRLGGGIGTRGPGEKKLETDKRRIRRRIFELETEISKLAEQRSLRRATRTKNRVQEVALVGYTNAGKSSLLNAVSDAGVLAEDKLFATLDPITRKVQLPSGKEVLFTDTVGFISKLPHDLISAFRSTLEETMHADLLLNVVDISDAESAQQAAVVREVLGELGAGAKPMITVYNKADLIGEIPQNKNFFISARKKEGIDELLAGVEKALAPKVKAVKLSVPYNRGDVLAQVQKHAVSINMEYSESAIEVSAELPVEAAQQIEIMLKK